MDFEMCLRREVGRGRLKGEGGEEEKERKRMAKKEERERQE